VILSDFRVCRNLVAQRLASVHLYTHATRAKKENRKQKKAAFRFGKLEPDLVFIGIISSVQNGEQAVLKTLHFRLPSLDFVGKMRLWLRDCVAVRAQSASVFVDRQDRSVYRSACVERALPDWPISVLEGWDLSTQLTRKAQ